MSKFVAIVLFAIVSAATATQHVDVGHSEIYQKQEPNGHYNFGYDIKDPWGASNYRQESGDGWGNVQGSYGLKDVDGRQRNVHYVADKAGFRVKLESNEPSVDSVDSADAIYNGPDPVGHSVTYVPSGYSGKDSWGGDYKGHEGNKYGYEAVSYKHQDGWQPKEYKESWETKEHKDSWSP